MKRSRLTRRTPLKSTTQLHSNTPLQAKTPLRSTARLVTRTPLRAVSLRRQRENRERRQVVAAMYEARPWCARCGKTDVTLAGHEMLGRSQGGDLTKPDVLLCHDCNEWCEDHPIEAAAAGWKISRKHPREN
jgi:hypothetical protein